MGKSSKIAGGILVLGGVALVALTAGFVAFVDGVQAWTPPDDPRAEGIVVLTGGAARIDGALKLLSEGRADRLLISGVNPAVGTEAIAAPRDDSVNAMLACCVDLGHAAQDTIGNATETRDWVAAQGFHSLIVVTSAYHMPRSLTELAEAMPSVTLVPYPVANPDLNLRDWWKTPSSFSLLVREYGKFLVASARNFIGRSTGATTQAGESI